MPVADRGAAKDAIFKVLSDAWTAASQTAPILYQDQDREKPATGPYLEAKILHTDSKQVAIGDSGRKRICAYGKLTVAVYTPPGDGLSSSDLLSKIVQDAYEKKRNTSPDGVLFRKTSIVEDGIVGGYEKVRVITYFEYDRIVGMT
jgi:hypothetical protein